MPPDDHIREIFQNVCALPAESRPAALDRLCGDDAATRAEVQSLLIHHDDPYGFVDTIGTGAVAVPADASGHDHAFIGQRLGRYRIVRKIADGGMGAVFEAEQDSPRRSVALKLVRPDLATPKMRRRLEDEGELLGRLHHPGIAQIFEAGTVATPAGEQPFFAMELVAGTPVIAYARANGLDVRRKLDLLARIADAVHHAHQQGIIHRDLKPSNILVDSAGQPKILDFGVARNIDRETAATTLATRAGELVGTIPYMSPEQARGALAQIDVRSDVYALGMVGYELLAGALPHELDQRPIAEALRIVQEEEPPRLGLIDPALRGDVETIVAKTLEKDKEHRYESAASLAADIRRALADEPITARPPSARYQLTKFARRHRPLLAGVAAAFVLLVLGVAGTGYGMLKARTQLGETEHSREGLAIVIDFLEHMLASSSPGELGRDTLVRDVLAVAGQGIEEVSDRPRVEARLRQVIGTTYGSLGDYESADRHLSRALEIAQEQLGPAHPLTISSMNDLARVYEFQSLHEEAAALAQRAHDAGRTALGPGHAETLTAKAILAMVAQDLGNLEEAEALLLETLALRREHLGVTDAATLSTINNLGIFYQAQGRYEEAEQMYAEALERRREILGPEHPQTLNTLNNFGTMCYHLGRDEEAERSYREVMEVRLRVLGDDHPSTAFALSNLAVLYRKWERYEEAKDLLERALDIRRRRLGDENEDTLTTLNNLAAVYHRMGRYEEVEPLYERIVEVRCATVGRTHWLTLITLGNLATLYVEQERHDEALPIYAEIVESARQQERPWLTGALLSSYGRCLTAAGRYVEAEGALQEALDILRGKYGADHDRTRTAIERMADLYEASGRADEAAALRAELGA